MNWRERVRSLERWAAPVGGRQRLLGSQIACLIGTAHLAAFLLEVGPVTQLPTALLFYMFCPGVVLIDWIDLEDLSSRIALVVATSLASNVVTATLLLYLGTFSPSDGVIVIWAVTVGLAAITFASRAQVHPAELR